MAQLNHSPRHLTDPSGWVLYLAHADATRLVVFLHGFGGQAVGTWQQFPVAAPQWWATADLLFARYDSRTENITGVAARLRRVLPRFFPRLPADMVTINGVSVRSAEGQHYEELYLVGHSLGGVILRRMMCDLAHAWVLEGADVSARPPLLSGTLRLFSPASAGFRPAGLLGLTRATPLWQAINIWLRRSSSYTDLERDSPILVETRQRTEDLVGKYATELAALRASIVWANPDDVVFTERYDTDRLDDAADGQNHRSVCKPHGGYGLPWTFVELGGTQ